MICSREDILRSMSEPDGIRINPFDEKHVQPASYDLHLHHQFMFFHERDKQALIDPRESVDPLMETWSGALFDRFCLRPGKFVLALTKERINIPLYMTGNLHGKSSLGRLGLTIHSTAGLIDPGNNLNITLEIFNQSPHSILLIAGMPIAQIVFTMLVNPCTKGYSGKYLNPTNVGASQMHLNFKNKL